MEMKIEKVAMVDYIEISFMDAEKVEIEYIGTDGETIKMQHAETLAQGLELIAMVDSVGY